MSRLTNIAILLLGIALLASSCSAREKMVQPMSPQSFEWLTANMDIQAVWLSVTATMGVEVLRAKVSNDSVWIVNRLEKTYLAEPLDVVSAQLGIPLSLPWVQTLFLDNNEGLPPVENQTVLLKVFFMGDITAKARYNNIKLNEKTTFPLKITDKMERVRLQKQN